MCHIAIYTALTKGYDELHQPESIHANADYFCFSNDMGTDRIGVWKICPIPFSHPDPSRVSRFPKLNPHLVLPTYQESLYVDANVSITQELNTAIDRASISECPCSMVPHPDRQSVYEEGLFLIQHSMGEPFRVFHQVQELEQSGFKDDGGLFVCSLIFRRHLDQHVIAFSEAWWKGFQKGSKRDQLSVMPALSAAGLRPNVLVSSEYVRRNTTPHVTQKRHSLAWHGWHFFLRKILEAKLLHSHKNVLETINNTGSTIAR